MTCPCGQPYHYPTAEDQAAAEADIAEHGWWTIRIGGRNGHSWHVPRHYLNLHPFAVTEATLPGLARRYRWLRADHHKKPLDTTS